MPWCENKDCGKKDLKKDEVVFDEKNHRVLCVPCGHKESVSQQPAIVTELVDKKYIGLHYTSDQGLKAEIMYGGAHMIFEASNDQIKKALADAGVPGIPHE